MKINIVNLWVVEAVVEYQRYEPLTKANKTITLVFDSLPTYTDMRTRLGKLGYHDLCQIKSRTKTTQIFIENSEPFEHLE